MEQRKSWNRERAAFAQHICVERLVHLPSTLPGTWSDTPSSLVYSEPALPVLEKLVTAWLLPLGGQLTTPDLEGEGGREGGL